MSDPKYFQTGLDKTLAHAVEECGEFLAAAGKTQRWGLFSYNPELPANMKRETNVEWMRREMADVRESLDRLEKELDLVAPVKAA